MAAVGDRIETSFTWQGPTRFEGGSFRSVDLHIEGIETKICVDLPNSITPQKTHKLPFTCTELDGEKIQSQVLKLTAGEVSNLSITAAFHTTKQPPQKRDVAVVLAISGEPEAGGRYSVAVMSNKQRSLAAVLEEPTLPNANSGRRGSEVRFIPGIDASPPPYQSVIPSTTSNILDKFTAKEVKEVEGLLASLDRTRISREQLPVARATISAEESLDTESAKYLEDNCGVQ